MGDEGRKGAGGADGGGKAGYRASDVRDYVQSLYDWLNQDEGILYGSPDKAVSKVQVCWMADVAAIRNALSIGADMIVGHESLCYPHDVLNTGGVKDFMSWKTNHARLRLLGGADITFMRAHGTLDRFCVYDDFAGMLGLERTFRDPKDFSRTVFDVPPITYGEMIAKVKAATGMARLRATNGDRGRAVRRVGLPWGGLGLLGNCAYMQKLAALGCDLFIAGETCNYGFRFAVDAGIDMIETGHEISENPGMRRFAETLKSALPGLEVAFYENLPEWDTV
ncbi:MAG: Nif3-like dinuclear metal center hexameric protein [Oscillospiraceae bacterium]|nr:Nif3-like dinuclear metal center hexameric protein [Oscillospiraceae bacterium]